MEFLLDDEIHLPQLMQSCGATSIFEGGAFAVRSQGEFRVLVQEAFDRPPIWDGLESATTQFSLNELPTRDAFVWSQGLLCAPGPESDAPTLFLDVARVVQALVARG